MENKDSTIAASGAFGLGTFAVIFSLCCVGPFMITLVGVSGAIFIASFEPYRIYIIAVAAVLLAFSFWRVYRKTDNCATGTCQVRSQKKAKIMLWMSTAMVVISYFMDDILRVIISPL
ncbi:MAG TPA: hypothetical protein DCR64_04075 [Vibrio sp.]|nr:hypothetical protein [Vibrio sp.]